MSHEYLDIVPEFFIKQGDTGPRVWARLEDSQGNIQPLGAGDSVWFFLRDPDDHTTILVEAAGTIEDAEGAIVSYIWQTDDTDLEPGTYDAEFEVRNLGSGKRETYPNDGYIQVHITGDIADAP